MESEVVPLRTSVHTTIMRNVNTITQTFECVLVIHTRWSEVMDSPGTWEPAMLFLNAVDQVKELHRRVVRVPFGGALKATQVLIVSGTFAEHFELRQFPVDCQRLSISIELINCPMPREGDASVLHDDRTSIEIGLQSVTPDRTSDTNRYFDQRYVCNVGRVLMLPGGFIDNGTWDIVEPFAMATTQTDRVYHPDGTSFCKLVAFVTVERRPQPFFWYFVFPVSLQIMLALSTVLLGHGDISSKLQVSTAILLTMFAIKFSSAKYLPTVAVLTYLDRYFVAATAAVAALIAQNLAVYEIYRGARPRAATLVNVATGGAMAVAWAVAHACVYAVMLSRRIRHVVLMPEVEGVRRPDLWGSCAGVASA